MKNQCKWLVGPAVWVAFILVLLTVWAIMDPARLVCAFDNNGRSPFELATLPFYLAIVPAVWAFDPFEGSALRRRILKTMVTVVALMAVVKELDLHYFALQWFYPDLVDGKGLIPGNFFKPNGAPLSGTPFKMRVLTNALVPFGMKAIIVSYFVLFFGVFAAGLAYLFPAWIKGVFKLDAACWSFGCMGASGVMVQIADRLPAWLGLASRFAKGSDSVDAAQSFMTCFEEGGEMMIAVFAILTIVLAHYDRLRKAA